MSKMKITKKEYTFTVDGKEYILVKDGSRYDLFQSLKAQDKAKENVEEITEKLGRKAEYANLPNHKDRDKPHSDTGLEFLEKIINETK